MQDTKVREFIHAAQGEPVTALENGKPAEIVLSLANSHTMQVVKIPDNDLSLRAISFAATRVLRLGSQ